MPDSERSAAIWRAGCWLVAVGTLTCLLVAPVPASAAMRSYVVSWFTQGMYSTEGDCPGGINPPIEVQWAIDLVVMGY